MKFWKCKGTSKPLWIVAIVFVIFLIGINVLSVKAELTARKPKAKKPIQALKKPKPPLWLFLLNIILIVGIVTGIVYFLRKTGKI